MKNVSLRTQRKQQRIIQTALIATIGLLAVGLAAGQEGLLQLLRLQHLKRTTQNETARLAEEIARARHEKTLLKSETYLRRVARKELGMIEEGETIFLLPEFP